MAEITNLRDTSSTTESELETNQTEEVEVTAQNAEDKADREIIGITSQATDEEQSGAAEDGATVDSKNRQDFEKLKALPYLDLLGQYRTAQKSIADLKSAKSMMDQIGDITMSDDAKNIDKMDALSKAGIDDHSIKDFYDHYEENVSEGERIIDLMARMLMVYDTDMLGSTAFISKSAMEAADRRLTMVDMSNPNAQNVVKRIELTRQAYANRTDYSMLFHKMRYPHTIVKFYNEFSKDPDKSMKYVDSVFMKVFNDQYMKRFRNAFKNLCFDGADGNMSELAKSKIDVDIFFITYWLARVYEQEYDTGKCAYVKNLVMNVYDADPSSNIFDLIGGTAYLASVCFTIYSMMAIITSGNFTSKEIHDEINKIMDTVMEKLLAVYQDMIIDFPGRMIQLDTSFKSITDDMSYDDLPELDVPDPEIPDAAEDAANVEESIDEELDEIEEAGEEEEAEAEEESTEEDPE